jgi:AmmeMemoRadiSam system protein B
MDHGAWDMPMGQVPINKELAAHIAQSSLQITVDDVAHRFEHSLEVQVPFLQYLQKNLSIAPIVVSHVSYETCVAVGQGLAEAIGNFGKDVLIVASTDMTHYESRQSASAKDSLALDRIKALDPQGLYNTVVGNRISMCGIMPTTVALIAAQGLGAKNAELIRYTDSGETSGDTSQVVGYAGLLG